MAAPSKPNIEKLPQNRIIIGRSERNLQLSIFLLRIDIIYKIGTKTQGANIVKSHTSCRMRYCGRIRRRVTCIIWE